ncbi:NAD-dependent deacylase [Parvularcula dongshanensis]|uniref:NAD-dependent protein deacylase n=1 Tax=Parvularcula dongshanensis TaxID=1173995 RepID=A0A840I0U1_9PROT|nr:NAD-dependent deacylase [Parvularcula dongshanensis]MBB4657955.1 NAD-dependent deacetylase [Parvularcula dongshanensis]
MSAPSLVVLTGAGVSADSGVDTFRTAGGLWDRYDWREVATPEGFAADPGKVHAFYNERRRALPGVRPNAAHAALAELEARLEANGGRLTLVTQNVDDLHERAGSRRVLHVHGELAKAACVACGTVSVWTADLGTEIPCPSCGVAGAMRPHVVWFGEMPRHLDEAEAALGEADLFVSIGTSGSVYPAAGLVAAARARGVDCTELNLEPSANARLFTEARYGRAAEIVPAFAKEMTW